MALKIEAPAVLLTAESKPYDFNGNQGVSHKIRINVDGEIYECKSTEAQVSALKSQEGKGGIATVAVNSRKERMSLELVSFVPEKVK